MAIFPTPLLDADRQRLQTALENTGVSPSGGKQFSSAQIVTDARDRQQLAVLMSRLLSPNVSMPAPLAAHSSIVFCW
jgi:hypothetical protein